MIEQGEGASLCHLPKMNFKPSTLSSNDGLPRTTVKWNRQLIDQRFALQFTGERAAHTGGDELTPPPHIEAIEVQTDLPWEDLADVFGKLLDARFAALNESIQT